jgi:hypothetical protein
MASRLVARRRACAGPTGPSVSHTSLVSEKISFRQLD